jgi:hypothetical protein
MNVLDKWELNSVGTSTNKMQGILLRLKYENDMFLNTRTFLKKDI